jgi:sec-independent protein translocase protein TatA
MGRIGGGELLLILLVALLIWGPSKLADMGKGLGEGLKNFKKGLTPEDDPKPMTKPSAPVPGAQVPSASGADKASSSGDPVDVTKGAPPSSNG